MQTIRLQKQLLQRLCSIVALLALLAVSEVQAASKQALAKVAPVAAVPASMEALSAHETVERTTRQLIVLIKEAQQYIDEDEPRFYRELGELLQQYVDFKSFSRAVMGRYASSGVMQSLDAAQSEQLQRQIDRFATIFTDALINTYGKGLLVFQGERIEVVPPDDASVRTDRATVKQLIYGDRDTPYEIYYSLRINEQGEWKIRNMILETTNLGKVYRNQFDNAYKIYEGDIDRVIDNWVSG